MGDKFTGHELTGGYEAVGLAGLCEHAYPFPSTELKCPPDVVKRDLTRHIQSIQRSALAKRTIAGGKYPHLCALGDELIDICGAGLRVIHIDRPINESIASLKTRVKKNKPNTSEQGIFQTEKVQRWLYECKNNFLSKVDNLHIQYHDLLVNPKHQIDRIIKYLGIVPTTDQIESAISHVNPDLRKHYVQ